MSRLDEVLKVKGVLMVGRFGPGWQLVENKTTSLFFETPGAFAAMGSFCAAVQAMFYALSVSMAALTPAVWSPVHRWTVSAGAYTVELCGDSVVLAQTDMVRSFDEIRELLDADDTSRAAE